MGFPWFIYLGWRHTNRVISWGSSKEPFDLLLSLGMFTPRLWFVCTSLSLKLSWFLNSDWSDFSKLKIDWLGWGDYLSLLTRVIDHWIHFEVGLFIWLCYPIYWLYWSASCDWSNLFKLSFDWLSWGNYLHFDLGIFYDPPWKCSNVIFLWCPNIIELWILIGLIRPISFLIGYSAKIIAETKVLVFHEIDYRVWCDALEFALPYNFTFTLNHNLGLSLLYLDIWKMICHGSVLLSSRFQWSKWIGGLWVSFS